MAGPTTGARSSPLLTYKRFTAFQGKSSSNGQVEAFVSVFGVTDYDGDVIDLGAFVDTITKRVTAGKTFPVVWMHDWSRPIGRTIEIEELAPGDERLPERIREFGGLRVVGQLSLDTRDGHDMFVFMRDGVIDEFSIGFFVAGEVFIGDGSDVSPLVRHITKVDLVEWSPVLLGANPMTELVSVRTALKAAGSTQGAIALRELIGAADAYRKARPEKGIDVRLESEVTALLDAAADLVDAAKTLTDEPTSTTSDATTDTTAKELPQGGDDAAQAEVVDEPAILAALRSLSPNTQGVTP